MDSPSSSSSPPSPSPNPQRRASEFHLPHIFPKLFGFRRVPVSVGLILIYTFVFACVFVTDKVRSVPSDEYIKAKWDGLSFEEAYKDLHNIANRPHPYNSHANDLVHSYLLTRLNTIVKGHDFATVEEDFVSRPSWYEARRGAISFEGTNLLVKVQGTEPEFEKSGGVLFSAHYDSVSTAPGTTDDGIGVVTLLQLVKYLTNNRPRRTAIFNINNGEEDGLNGAHAFLEHPWARIPDTFLNLEGASAGGRPLLFRASSVAPVRSFAKSSLVSYPHGNVLSADAFARGVIRSGTDYEIYNNGFGNGTYAMEGIDFAFYQGRAQYHTKYDSIPGAGGARRSLWAMMDSVLGAGWSLLNDDETHVDIEKGPKAPVYFDVFGSTIIIFEQKSLLAFDIAMLALGPLALIFFHHLPSILSKRVSERRSTPTTATARILASLRYLFTRGGIWRDAWSWGKFWVSFILLVLVELILVCITMKANQNVAYSRGPTILVSFLTGSYLTLALALRVSKIGSMLKSRLQGAVATPSCGTADNGASRQSSTIASPDQKKYALFTQLYILAWFILLLATLALSKLQIGGTYFLTAWYLFIFLGTVLASIERVLQLAQSHSPISKGKTQDVSSLPTPEEPVAVTPQSLPNESPAKSATVAPLKSATERTPLLGRICFWKQVHVEEENGGAIGWWIFEALLAIPIPAILLSQVLLVFSSALSQTSTDGSSPVTLYAVTGILSALIVLPTAPFSIKLHYSLIFLIFFLFFGTTVYNWTAAPFTPTAPLKLFFQQRVQLDLSSRSQAGNETAQIISATSALVGLPQYVSPDATTGVSPVIGQLPSAEGKNVSCSGAGPGGVLRACQWESELYPSHGTSLPPGEPGANSTSTSTSSSNLPWIRMNATRLASPPNTARVVIQGANTRHCRVYLDNRMLAGFRVYALGEEPADATRAGAMQAIQRGYEIPDGGADALWLWSRTWDRRFVVDLTWVEGGGGGEVQGRVACAWAEYKSAMVGLGDGDGTTSDGAGAVEGVGVGAEDLSSVREWDSGARIPALEEALTFLPNWVTVTKLGEGLVEAWGEFSL